nr:unnamed protein product [Callosobruchus analis]
MNIRIKSLYNEFSRELNCLVLDEITGNIPHQPIHIDNLPIPENLALADPKFNQSQRIDCLLGVSIFYELLCIGQIKLGRGQPILQKTHLGWVISGPISNYPQQSTCLVSLNSVHDQLEKFWLLEEVSEKRILSKSEQLCEDQFKDTTVKDVDGRFVVSLPLKSNYNELGTNFENAKKRFLNIERRMQQNESFANSYKTFMSEGFWREDPNQELGHYVLNTVTYGTAPASFLATRALHQAAYDKIS